jgi:hypothetical protein
MRPAEARRVRAGPETAKNSLTVRASFRTARMVLGTTNGN